MLKGFLGSFSYANPGAVKVGMRECKPFELSKTVCLLNISFLGKIRTNGLLE